MRKFLSICIPSYNRPKELRRLLDSIDASDTKKIEIVIREDMSPNREYVRKEINEYRRKSSYSIRYIENEQNFGYDKNIRSLAEIADGEWVMFMGDDDVFIPGSLDRFISFLNSHSELGYILRRYKTEYASGAIEEYRYAKNNVFFDEGEETIVELFRRSLFISGFTFKHEFFSDYSCTEYDGSLLFQLYILSCICLKHPSAYCDIPITKSIEGGVPFFGNSEAEKKLYIPGENSFDNSINFLKQVRVLVESFDRKYGTTITPGILRSYSKYSYGYLHEHREDGKKVFKQYAKEIKKIGLGDSLYFYIYYYLLLFLGRKNCRRLIRTIKKLLGKTPRL